MLGARDVGWAVAVGALLMALVQYRAEQSAKGAVERDAEQGFLQVYEGSRFVTGELVSPGRAASADPHEPAIETRRFELVGTRPSLSGRSIEILARHVIKLANGAPGGEDASQEVHAKLERRGKVWAYTLFETRDGQLLDPAAEGNPWARALIARRGNATGTAPGSAESVPAAAPAGD